MIKKIDIEDGLPVSVIVPLQEKRKSFFYGFVLPLIIANKPSEIIINDNEGSAGKKRNEGFLQSKNPFIFFCDDDILLAQDYLSILYSHIQKEDCGYVYTGYKGIVINTKTNQFKNNFIIETQEFKESLLRQRNFISTMSLMRREVFPMFDETLERYMDYDIYLNMLSKGIKGKAVHDIYFFAFYLDEGITSIHNHINIKKIMSKYNF